MRHNQVTMECKILSQAQGQNFLVIYANTVPLKYVELHLLMLKNLALQIQYCENSTILIINFKIGI